MLIRVWAQVLPTSWQSSCFGLCTWENANTELTSRLERSSLWETAGKVECRAAPSKHRKENLISSQLSKCRLHASSRLRRCNQLSFHIKCESRFQLVEPDQLSVATWCYCDWEQAPGACVRVQKSKGNSQITECNVAILLWYRPALLPGATSFLDWIIAELSWISDKEAWYGRCEFLPTS